jgi:hypothetical protein
LKFKNKKLGFFCYLEFYAQASAEIEFWYWI